MKLALQLPWEGATATIAPGFTPKPGSAFVPANSDLGQIITSFSEVALYVGGFMMFFWAVWGVFDYLRAEGNKEALAKARKRIQWAIAGFIILLMAFFVSDFLYAVVVEKAFPGWTQPIQNLTVPK